MKNQLILTITILLLGISQSHAQSQLPPASATEDWSVKPPVVTPGKKYAEPPSDAVILFSGKKDLAEWKHADGSQVKWQANGIPGLPHISLSRTKTPIAITRTQ